MDKDDHWFYRQMYKTLATYTDEQVIEQMKKTPATHDQLALTSRFEIRVSDDGLHKEVWAMSPKVKDIG